MAKNALELLKTNKSVNIKADKYAPRIKESLRIKTILPLKEEIEAIEDQIFDLEDFSLDTDLNKGQKKLTKGECEDRFNQIIHLKYNKAILELEYKIKKESFDSLFGEIESTDE